MRLYSLRRCRTSIAPRAILLSTLASASARAQTLELPQHTLPDRYEHVRPNRPLLWASAATLAGTYAGSVIVGAASNSDADHNLYIPVIGPWLALAAHDCTGPQSTNCQTGTGRGIGLFLDGLAQTAGAVGVGLAFLIPQTKAVQVAPGVAMMIRPDMVGSGGGIVVALHVAPE